MDASCFQESKHYSPGDSQNLSLKHADSFFLPEARGACLADEAGEVSTKVSLLHPRESEISDLLSRKKAPFSETERKEAIFSMPGDKAPGPDLMGKLMSHFP